MPLCGVAALADACGHGTGQASFGSNLEVHMTQWHMAALAFKLETGRAAHGKRALCGSDIMSVGDSQASQRQEPRPCCLNPV